MQKLFLASNNPGKAAEITQLLQRFPFEIIQQADSNIPDIEETGSTFIENAIIKARHACQQSRLPALADDSGLSVNALGGKPGVHSARYAGSGASDADRIDKLLLALQAIPREQRQAQFHCVIAVIKVPDDPAPLICHGVWSGSILFAPQGDQGFGYDPIFWVPDYHCSAAQLGAVIKNSISHRARAFEKLYVQLQAYLTP